MTITTLLRQKIDESGYKLQFLAEKCGYHALYGTPDTPIYGLQDSLQVDF